MSLMVRCNGSPGLIPPLNRNSAQVLMCWGRCCRICFISCLVGIFSSDMGSAFFLPFTRLRKLGFSWMLLASRQLLTASTRSSTVFGAYLVLMWFWNRTQSCSISGWDFRYVRLSWSSCSWKCLLGSVLFRVYVRKSFRALLQLFLVSYVGSCSRNSDMFLCFDIKMIFGGSFVSDYLNQYATNLHNLHYGLRFAPFCLNVKKLDSLHPVNSVILYQSNALVPSCL